MKPRFFVGAAAVTPGPTNLTRSGSAVIATVAGTVTGITDDGSTLTAFPLPAGIPVNLAFVRITAATATGLFVLW